MNTISYSNTKKLQSAKDSFGHDLEVYDDGTGNFVSIVGFKFGPSFVIRSKNLEDAKNYYKNNICEKVEESELIKYFWKTFKQTKYKNYNDEAIKYSIHREEFMEWLNQNETFHENFEKRPNNEGYIIKDKHFWIQELDETLKSCLKIEIEIS
jgi:hypothetical protein